MWPYVTHRFYKNSCLDQHISDLTLTDTNEMELGSICVGSAEGQPKWAFEILSCDHLQIKAERLMLLLRTVTKQS